MLLSVKVGVMSQMRLSFKKRLCIGFCDTSLQRCGGTVEELRNYARRLEVQEQVREWQFITEELQEKKKY